MKTVPLNELFEIQYGNKFDLNKMELLAKSEGGISFVNRSSRNCGISASVASVAGIAPFEAGSITVSLGGSKLLSSFVQPERFYTGQNVAVLFAKQEMTFAEKLYVCLCIRHNRFRYTAFGREANRTLRTLPIPARSEFPDWLADLDLSQLGRDYEAPYSDRPTQPLTVSHWKRFKLSQIFEIKKGSRVTKANMKPGSTPFISAIDSNNGIRQHIGLPPAHPGNLITVNYNGSVAEAFYQPEPFWASDDVNVLYSKFTLDAVLAMFLCTIIRREKYRFNYGRKWNLERMNDSEIRLPAGADGAPDWAWMRQYILSQNFSSQLYEDAKDVEVARHRLKEIQDEPQKLIQGHDLQMRLESARSKS